MRAFTEGLGLIHSKDSPIDRTVNVVTSLLQVTIKIRELDELTTAVNPSGREHRDQCLRVGGNR